MPSKVFSVLDAFNHVFTPDPTATVLSGLDGATSVALSTLLTSPGIGSWVMDPNLSATTAGGLNGALCQINTGAGPALIQTWEVDFARISNPIPDHARIKKLTFNRPRNVNYDFAATVSDDENKMDFAFLDGALAPIYFTEVREEPFVSPKVVNESIVGIPADEVLFDHTSGPTFVTKAELIALWSSFDNNLEVLLVESRSNEPVGNVSTLAGSLEFGDGWTVTVEYEEGFQWDLSQSTSPVDEGSTVNLTSDPAEALAVQMDDITSIEIQFLDPANPTVTITIPVTVFTVIDANNLVFTIPSLGGDEPIILNVVITSTQFSGDLALGYVYTVFLVSAPGIYKFVPDQRFDRLYDRTDPDNIVTIDIKIPDPFIKTGPING